MKTTLTLLTLLITLTLYAQKNVTDYFITYERYSQHISSGYLVSYDMDMNLLGKSEITIQDRSYYYTPDHIFVYSLTPFGSNGFIYKYDKYFNLIKKSKLRKGGVDWVQFQEDFILVKINFGLFTYYTTYNTNLEILGELKKTRGLEFAGFNKNAIIFTEAKKGSTIITQKVHLYDTMLKLVRSTDCAP